MIDHIVNADDEIDAVEEYINRNGQDLNILIFCGGFNNERWQAGNIIIMVQVIRCV